MSAGSPELDAGRSRWDRALPGLARMRELGTTNLGIELLAGVTVAAYLVPQCMAYGELAGLPPVVGIWAALVPIAVYAFVGGSRQLSVGPESTTALMTATALAPLAAGDPARYAALAAGLALGVAAVAFGAWALRAGFVANLLSRPILAGYMSGIGLTMISSQLGKITDVPVEGDTFFQEVRSFLSQLDAINRPTLVMAMIVLAFLLVVRSRWPRLPGPLIAVVVATIAVSVFDLTQYGIEVIGAVPTGLPGPKLPAISWSDIPLLAGPAFGIAIVAYSDIVLTARAFALRHGDKVDANRELLALGFTSAGAGLFQGFPISSSGSRTAIAEDMGARSQRYALSTLASLVLVLLVLAPLLADFPKLALGAIVIAAGISLIDVPAFRALRRFRTSEFLLACAALLGVLATNILIGVLIAVGLSVAEMLSRLMRPHAAVLGFAPEVAGMHDIDDFADMHQEPGLLVFRYDAPLMFANADDFEQRALAAFDRAEGPVRWFLLNAETQVGIDSTAAAAFGDLLDTCDARGVHVAVARAKQELLADLDRAGLVDRIGADSIFPTLPTAVEAFRAAQSRDQVRGEDADSS